jgi:hypothetical protein
MCGLNENENSRAEQWPRLTAVPVERNRSTFAVELPSPKVVGAEEIGAIEYSLPVARQYLRYSALENAKAPAQQLPEELLSTFEMSIPFPRNPTSSSPSERPDATLVNLSGLGRLSQDGGY